MITSQAGVYLRVDELIEIAKLLGLNSQGDVSAAEAVVAGDLQLAFDLCLSLAKKGHGPIWDLCVVMARGPALENMGINSQKQLLGSALNHCDEESIDELLHACEIYVVALLVMLNRGNKEYRFRDYSN